MTLPTLPDCTNCKHPYRLHDVKPSFPERSTCKGCYDASHWVNDKCRYWCDTEELADNIAELAEQLTDVCERIHLFKDNPSEHQALVADRAAIVHAMIESLTMYRRVI